MKCSRNVNNSTRKRRLDFVGDPVIFLMIFIIALINKIKVLGLTIGMNSSTTISNASFYFQNIKEMI